MTTLGMTLRDRTPAVAAVTNCPDCNRAVRPYGTKKEDYPGTLAAALADGCCHRCWKIRQGRTIQPMDVSDGAIYSAVPEWIQEIRDQATKDGFAAYVANRRRRGISPYGMPMDDVERHQIEIEKRKDAKRRLEGRFAPGMEVA